MPARPRFALPVALAAALAAAPAAGQVPVLVELFTSEGCSSCPPADALLSRLAREPLPGVRVVALSEHVDYWNGPGWSDRFSSPAFTRRQEEYVRRLGLQGPYTPELVVAGHLDVLGSDGRAARAAIASAAREPQGRVEVRLLPGEPGAEAVAAVEASWAGGRAAEVLLAVVQDHAESQVTGGENAGRSLAHVAVVRTLTSLGTGKGAFAGQARVRRPQAAGRWQVVVFAQEVGGGPVRAVGVADLP